MSLELLISFMLCAANYDITQLKSNTFTYHFEISTRKVQFLEAEWRIYTSWNYAIIVLRNGLTHIEHQATIRT